MSGIISGIGGAMGSLSSGIGGALSDGSQMLGLGKPSGSSFSKYQAGSSILSGIGSYQSGMARAAGDQMSAQYWRAQKANEPVQAQNSVGGLKQQLMTSVGRMGTQLAGSGIDIGQGVGQASRTALQQGSVTAQQNSILAGNIRQSRDETTAIQADYNAQQAKKGGMIGLVGGLAQGALSLLAL